MKQIKAFVHRNRVSDLIHALEAGGFKRLSLFDVKGLLRALSAREQQYSVEFGDQVISEVQMELFCEDIDVARAVEIFQRVGRTGRVEAGWVYVSNVEQAVAIGDVSPRVEMAEGHEHVSEIKHEKPLWWAFGLTTAFLIAEVIGGLLTNSLALLSDAAHMGTDVIALAISLFAVRMSRKPPDAKRTYGFARMEAIGAMINGGMLFLVAGYILWEAVGRFRQPPEISSTGMLVIAALGLIVNLISMRLLKAGSGESLNVKGAYLEVWADMLGSVGVIIGAVVIMVTGWTLVDPIIAVLIGLWVLPRTWKLLREAGQVLMQGVPAGIDLDKVRDMMLAHPGVAKVHDLHVWALGSKEPVLTAHIILTDETQPPDAVRESLAAALTEAFDIEHATLQVDASTLVESSVHA